MKQIWNFLNGKKTVLGLIASAIVIYLTAKGYIDAELATLLGTISGLIFTGGLAHKVQKAKAKKDD